TRHWVRPAIRACWRRTAGRTGPPTGISASCPTAIGTGAISFASPAGPNSLTIRASPMRRPAAATSPSSTPSSPNACAATPLRTGSSGCKPTTFPCGPVNLLGGLLEDQQLAAVDFFPVSEHSREILRELGRGETEIEDLF